MSLSGRKNVSVYCGEQCANVPLIVVIGAGPIVLGKIGCQKSNSTLKMINIVKNKHRLQF